MNLALVLVGKPGDLLPAKEIFSKGLKRQSELTVQEPGKLAGLPFAGVQQEGGSVGTRPQAAEEERGSRISPGGLRSRPGDTDILRSFYNSLFSPHIVQGQ